MKPLPSKNMTLAELDAYLAARKANAHRTETAGGDGSGSSRAKWAKYGSWTQHGSYPGIDLNDVFGEEPPRESVPPMPEWMRTIGKKLLTFLGIVLNLAFLAILCAVFGGGTHLFLIFVAVWLAIYFIRKFFREFKKQFFEELKTVLTEAHHDREDSN